MWGTENIWLIAAGGFAAFLANVCYMAGGTEGFGLWWRRILGVLILGLSTNILAIIMGVWAWQYLLFFPLLGAGMSLGYGGASSIGGKMLRRLVFALGVLFCCVAGMWATGFCGMGILISILALITGITSVALGAFNPFNNAPLEQFIISQVLTLYIPWWAFISRGA